MATEYAIVPSPLNITFVRGDEFGMLLDFDQSLSGYSFLAKIYEVASISGGIVTAGPSPFNFSVTNVDLGAGKVNLSLTETQTQSLDPAKMYRWYLRWVTPTLVTRTVLSGTITVGDP